MAWVLWLVLLTFTGTVSASDQNDARTRALALFKESATHYDAGRYAVAAALLEEAYALHPEPKLLYNLGRAREAEGDTQRAIEAYEKFLETSPEGARPEDLTQRVAELKQKLEQESPVPEPSPHDDTHTGPGGFESSSAGEDTPTDVPEPNRPVSRVVPWTILASGVALLGTAAAFSYLARSEHQAAESEPVQVEAEKLQRSAERKSLIANVLLGAGAAMTITGGAWLWFGRQRKSTPQALSNPAKKWAVRAHLTGLDCTISF